MEELQWQGLIQALEALPAHGILGLSEARPILHKQLKGFEVNALTVSQFLNAELRCECGGVCHGHAPARARRA